LSTACEEDVEDEEADVLLPLPEGRLRGGLGGKGGGILGDVGEATRPLTTDD